MINQTRFFTTEKANIPTNIANGTINANDLVITSDTHELYFVDENNNYFPITTTKEELGIDNVTNDAQIKGKASGTTENHVLTWGVDGYTVKDSGYTINKSVPVNAVFTDTTYSEATSSASGLMSAEDKAKLDGMDGGSKITIIELDGEIYGGGSPLAGYRGAESVNSHYYGFTGRSVYDTNPTLSSLIGDKHIIGFCGKLDGSVAVELYSINVFVEDQATPGVKYDVILNQNMPVVKEATQYVVRSLLFTNTDNCSSGPFHLYAVCI